MPYADRGTHFWFTLILLPFRGIVRLNRLGLNDDGRIAPLVVLTLVRNRTSDVASHERNAR